MKTRDKGTSEIPVDNSNRRKSLPFIFSDSDSLVSFQFTVTHHLGRTPKDRQPKNITSQKRVVAETSVSSRGETESVNPLEVFRPVLLEGSQSSGRQIPCYETTTRVSDGKCDFVFWSDEVSMSHR